MRHLRNTIVNNNRNTTNNKNNDNDNNNNMNNTRGVLTAQHVTQQTLHAPPDSDYLFQVSSIPSQIVCLQYVITIPVLSSQSF